MAATYAIVYSTNSKMIRRVIADDEGRVALGTAPDGRAAVITLHAARRGDLLSTSSLVNVVAACCGYHPLLAGESALIVSKSSDEPAHGFNDWHQQIFAATGVYPPRIRCALIDAAGIVRALIMADPEIDASPRDDLHLERCDDQTVLIGDAYQPRVTALAA